MHSAHQAAPAELLLGYFPRVLSDFLVKELRGVETVSQDAQHQLQQLQVHRQAACDAIKLSAD
jgi:hypothetical protein